VSAPEPPEPAERAAPTSSTSAPDDQAGEVRPGGPAAEPINAGVPASNPPTAAQWGPAAEERPSYPDYPRSETPVWAPPDPAGVTGPPWPALVAASPYQPPRLIRWPLVVGLALLAAWVGVVLAASAGASHSGGSVAWLAAHESTIQQLNQDQTALAADKPSGGTVTARWAADWQRFHDDASSAASLPNPGGAVTVPWREMLNDYATGSATYLQAVRTQNRGLLLQALRELTAGDQAARRFNQALGLPTG
jgi:hypothetical protein